MNERDYDEFWRWLDGMEPGDSVGIPPERAMGRFREAAHAEASARVACRARGFQNVVVTTVVVGETRSNDGRFAIQVRRIA